MDLDNATPFAARLIRARRHESAPFQATLIVKATFMLEGGRWRAAPGQVPIVDSKLETPFGLFHTDCFARKDGVDVCVLGTVRLPALARTADLELTLGETTRTLRLTGDRVWTKSGGRLVPSSPAPFDQMPLAYARAYGGTTEHDHEKVTFPDNPVGVGYYLSPEEAEMQPLPNIEDPQQPAIREWSDQPQVAGWGPYPCFWGIRAREGVEPPEKAEAGNVGKIKARLNNNAHPSLIFPPPPPSATVRIRGMRARDIVIPIPSFTPVLEVRLGQRKIVHDKSELDGIHVWVDAARLTLTRRIQFAYPYTKGEERGARLVLAARAKKN